MHSGDFGQHALNDCSNAMLAELLAGSVHRFRDPVAEQDHRVARSELQVLVDGTWRQETLRSACLRFRDDGCRSE